MNGPLVREVVEAVFDHRADRDLGVGEQFLDRIGQQVRRRMADEVQAPASRSVTTPAGIVVDQGGSCRRRARRALADAAGDRRLARPAPIDAATSATVGGASKARFDPSGSSIVIMGTGSRGQRKRRGGRPRLSPGSNRDVPGQRSANLEEAGGSSRCHNRAAFLPCCSFVGLSRDCRPARAFRASGCRSGGVPPLDPRAANSSRSRSASRTARDQAAPAPRDRRRSA